MIQRQTFLKTAAVFVAGLLGVARGATRRGQRQESAPPLPEPVRPPVLTVVRRPAGVVDAEYQFTPVYGEDGKYLHTRFNGRAYLAPATKLLGPEFKEAEDYLRRLMHAEATRVAAANVECKPTWDYGNKAVTLTGRYW